MDGEFVVVYLNRNRIARSEQWVQKQGVWTTVYVFIILPFFRGKHPETNPFT